ncbi:MAG TPA: hypothetical protein VNL14_13310 [Candidatus Acidoferrales bacterium]|nr:hypothetical protein [Candidatus Acidoferrales bacterium]
MCIKNGAMLYKAPSKRSLRLASAIAAFCLVFFLIELMPHRVHHMFDEDAQNSCIAFTISKGCALGASAATHVDSIAWPSPLLLPAAPLWASHRSPSPFDGRAPPSI